MYMNSRQCSDKQFDVGVIPHIVDYPLVKRNGMFGMLVDMNDTMENVVRNISRCRRTISSSLHGIIISEALGIPCTWARFSDKILGGDFKFKDYYLGTGRRMEDIKCFDFRNGIGIMDVEYAPKAKFDIAALIQSFPFEIDERLVQDIKEWFADERPV